MTSHDLAMEEIGSPSSTAMTPTNGADYSSEKTSLNSELPTRTQSGNLQSLTRFASATRSQNGFACGEDSEDEEDEAGGIFRPLSRPPTHAFEVTFVGGAADPDCPRSMSTLRKWCIIWILSGGGFTVTAASSIYTSTYAQLMDEFQTSRLVVTLGLSTFVLGISIGPMIFAPLSEFYGRRPIYWVSWVMYLIWLIPSAVAQNITTMIVARFFDGLSGSAFLVVSGGTVSDLFSREQLQAPMLLYSLMPFMGPVLGPLFGGFISYFNYWRWVFYILIIWAFVMLILIFFFVPETYRKEPYLLKYTGPFYAYTARSDPIVLRNKARRLRKETGEMRWVAPIETLNKSVAVAIGYSLLRPIQLLIYEVMVSMTCLFSAVLLGILYLFFGAFTLVFGGLHNFNQWQVGLTFIGIALGMVLAALADFMHYRLLAKRVKARAGHSIMPKMEPEDRLPPAIVGAVSATAGLFIFAWTSFDHVHWIAPIIGSVLFGAGFLLVYTGIFTFLVDAYPAYAASALAANAFVRCIFAAAFPLFGNQMYNKLGYRWASSLLAFLTLALLPFPYLFWRFGYRLRKHSKYSKSS